MDEVRRDAGFAIGKSDEANCCFVSQIAPAFEITGVTVVSRLIIRTVALALSFAFIFPHIAGFSFSGEFLPDALIYALLFAVTSAVVDVIAYIALAVVGVATLGLALIVIWPLRLLLWWGLAAYQLILLAQIFPEHMSVSGWQPALLAGLVVMAIKFVSAKVLEEKKS